MWVTFSLPRISTSPFVRVVFPVAESPTTPRMIGRAMCAVLPWSVSSKRATLAFPRIPACAGVAGSAVAQLSPKRRTDAQPRADPQHGQEQRRWRGVRAELTHGVRLPRREVAAVVAIAGVR